MSKRHKRRAVSLSPRDFALLTKIAEAMGFIHQDPPHEGRPNVSGGLTELIQAEADRRKMDVTPEEVEAVQAARLKRRVEAEELRSSIFTF